MRGLTAAGLVLAAVLAEPTGVRAADAVVAAPSLCRPPAALANDAEPAATRPYLRYDDEYPATRYGQVARTNPVARLQQRLAAGEVRLEYRAPRGYLDSLLTALDIDASSQLLVYSKSSLQKSLISPDTPRALYYNDDVYVGWVQGSDQIEIGTHDCELGPVFYIFGNTPGAPSPFRRESTRCLTCHDSVGLLGGGVPAFTVYSMPVDMEGGVFVNDNPVAVTDATPIADRWAGWYVTGRHGELTHLGNLRARTDAEFRALDRTRSGNLASVRGLIDASPYLTDKSDIVALMVFEHQAGLQTHLSRALFKSREILAREGGEAPLDRPLSALSPRVQGLYRRLLEPVVRSLLFADAVTLETRIEGGAGFEAWFEARGPRDAQGRSLREFDLGRRLFRHPLSYLIYSEAFDGLPRSAREYVYRRLDEVLSGRSADGYGHLTESDRRAIAGILSDTRPEYAAISRP